MFNQIFCLYISSKEKQKTVKDSNDFEIKHIHSFSIIIFHLTFQQKPKNIDRCDRISEEEREKVEEDESENKLDIQIRCWVNTERECVRERIIDCFYIFEIFKTSSFERMLTNQQDISANKSC